MSWGLIAVLAMVALYIVERNRPWRRPESFLERQRELDAEKLKEIGRDGPGA